MLEAEGCALPAAQAATHPRPQGQSWELRRDAGQWSPQLRDIGVRTATGSCASVGVPARQPAPARLSPLTARGASFSRPDSSLDRGETTQRGFMCKIDKETVPTKCTRTHARTHTDCFFAHREARAAGVTCTCGPSPDFFTHLFTTYACHHVLRCKPQSPGALRCREPLSTAAVTALTSFKIPLVNNTTKDRNFKQRINKPWLHKHEGKQLPEKVNKLVFIGQSRTEAELFWG